jgi:hypothetical protein
LQLSRQEIEEPTLVCCNSTLTKDVLPAAVAKTERYLDARNPRHSNSGINPVPSTSAADASTSAVQMSVAAADRSVAAVAANVGDSARVSDVISAGVKTVNSADSNSAADSEVRKKVGEKKKKDGILSDGQLHNGISSS